MSPYRMSVDNPTRCRVNVENLKKKKDSGICIPYSRNIVSWTETRGEPLLQPSYTNKRYYLLIDTVFLIGFFVYTQRTLAADTPVYLQ